MHKPGFGPNTTRDTGRTATTSNRDLHELLHDAGDGRLLLLQHK